MSALGAKPADEQPLSRADRKILRRGASGFCVRKMPPLAVVIAEFPFPHGLHQRVSPAPLVGIDGVARGMARRIAAIEAGARVDALVRAALRCGPGARPVARGP